MRVRKLRRLTARVCKRKMMVSYVYAYIVLGKITISYPYVYS